MAALPGGIYGANMIAQPQIDTRGPQYNNDATPKNPIGGRTVWNNQIWRYVQHNQGTGTVVPLLGGPAWAKTFTPLATATAVPAVVTTPDQTDSLFEYTPIGSYQCAVGSEPTHLYYTWILVGGLGNLLVVGGVEGDMVTGSGTDNQFARIAAGSALTRTQVGTRMEGASASGLSPVLLTGMDW